MCLSALPEVGNGTVRELAVLMAFDGLVTSAKAFDGFCLSFYAFDGFDAYLALARGWLHTASTIADPWLLMLWLFQLRVLMVFV